MTLKDKFIAILLLLLTASIVTAGMYRNHAIKAQAELDFQQKEKEIDDPYKKALAESEKERQRLHDELEVERNKANQYIISIAKYKKSLAELEVKYKALPNPNEESIKERYNNADMETICDDFADIGLPCKSVSR